MQEPTYYVYLIQKGYGSIKIGVSKDPESRLKMLQTGNPTELHLIAKFPCESEKQARALEADLHNEFREYRMKGEWFCKTILRKFRKRATILPNIFRILNKGERFNGYANNPPSTLNGIEVQQSLRRKNLMISPY